MADAQIADKVKELETMMHSAIEHKAADWSQWFYRCFSRFALCFVCSQSSIIMPLAGPQTPMSSVWSSSRLGMTITIIGIIAVFDVTGD